MVGARVGDFYTDSQGRVRPITKKTGALVAGAALVGTVALGTGGGAVGGAAVSEGLSAAAEARVTAARNTAARGQRGQTWKRLRVKQARNKFRPQRHLNCVRNSHGEVRTFFVLTPCRSLDRVLTVLIDLEGNTFVLSVYWVRMRNAAAAREFQELDDTFGTGNVNPVAGGLLGLVGVRFTGRYYDSRMRGPLVVVAEAEPVTGAPSGETLESVVRAVTYLPPP